jgi:hypothetical protein
MRILLLVFCVVVRFGTSAQSKTTESLHKTYDDALSLFFYNNTLRMLNQNDDKDFDELIKDIEKMKFLMIDKTTTGFGATDYKKLAAGYKGEAFEEIMTSRYQGKNFDVFLKEKSGKTLGMVVLVNDSASLYVLDIVGSIALDKVTSLYNTLDQSSDVSRKIKNFANRNNHKDEDEDDH